jgi:hypothetical protein
MSHFFLKPEHIRFKYLFWYYNYTCVLLVAALFVVTNDVRNSIIYGVIQQLLKVL